MSSLKNTTLILPDSPTLVTNGTYDVDELALRFSLHIADYVIIGVYIVLSLGLGFYLGKKQKTTADYFLAGKSTNWFFIGLSLFASDVSSSSLVALAGAAYSTGISVYNYVWMASVILIIYSVVFIPSLLRMELYTIPEFLERRFHVSTRYYFSILTMVHWFMSSVAGGLFAGSIVVKMAFPQLATWHAVTILAVVAGIYTISGGLKAVIYTDAFQTCALLLGSVMITVYTWIEAGSWSTVRDSVPADSLSLVRPIDDPSLPWTGLITGVPILGIYFWCCNQAIVQRVLSSKDINNGRLGCVLGGFLRLPVLFIMVLPGTMARIIYPNLAKGDRVYPALLFRLLPIGVKGIVLSGFLAALMSNVDSILNSAATLVTMDFVKKFKQDVTDKQLLNIGRLATFVFMIVSICWAPFLENFGSLYQYSQKLLSYMIPPIVALYMSGFFWKGANTTGAVLSLIVGNVAGIVFFITIEILNLYKVHFLHIAAILFTISGVAIIVGSLTNPSESTEAHAKCMWSNQEFIEDLKSQRKIPIWKNYLVHSVILLLSTALIVGLFW